MPRCSIGRRFVWAATMVGCGGAREAPAGDVHSVALTPVAVLSESRCGYDPVRPASFYLEHASLPTRHVRLAYFGRLHATEPGRGTTMTTRVGGAPAGFTDASLPVVEERPDAVRVIIDQSGIRLVAHVERGDLHRVVRRRARVGLGAGAAVDHGADGVWLQPGVLVTESNEGLQHVRVDDGAFHGDGWIAPADVGVVFAREPAATGAPVTIAAGTSIVTSGGTELVRVEGAVPAVASRAEGLRTRVRYDGDELLVEGWVPHDAVRPRSPAPPADGASWGRMGRDRFLHAGDRLCDPVGGEPIGVVTARRLAVDDDNGNVRIYLSGWGFLSLSVPPEDVARSQRWEAVDRQRARFTPTTQAPLPEVITARRREVADCWAAELANGGAGSHRLRLVWRGHGAIDVASLLAIDEPLRGCLTNALTHPWIWALEPATTPRVFVLHLEPTASPRPSSHGQRWLRVYREQQASMR